MREAIRRFESVTSTMTTEHALEVLRKADVPAAPVLGLDEHLADAQVHHNQIYEIEHDDRLGAVRVVRYPALLNGTRLRASFNAPLPGADYDSVVKDWDLDWTSENPSRD
jgi:crotonobetainyl-CoA:carnitine CoA-transferase CaiB-like acyl-CoA transferase